MARKSKKKRSNTPQASRAPIVSIKQKDEQLMQDLQGMKQKDAIKYGTHLMKMVSGNPDYEGLIFNIPRLLFLLKKYELEKKPSGLKSKIFKQSLAKEGSAYVLPQIVDGSYVARSKQLIESRFNSSEDHADKMALAIAKASLEMHGKVVQGVKVPMSEVPLFHIALSASMEIIQKVTKKEKVDKNGSQLDADIATDVFPRWKEDFIEFESKLKNELRTESLNAQKEIFLPAESTLILRRHLHQALENGQLQLDKLISKSGTEVKIKPGAATILKELAEKNLTNEILLQRRAISSLLESALKDNYTEIAYLFYAYFSFFQDVNPELLLPIYINQTLLHYASEDYSSASAEEILKKASKVGSKESELLYLNAAYRLENKQGEILLKISSLCKNLAYFAEQRILIEDYLQNDANKDDANYNKVAKEKDRLD